MSNNKINDNLWDLWFDGWPDFCFKCLFILLLGSPIIFILCLQCFFLGADSKSEIIRSVEEHYALKIMGSDSKYERRFAVIEGRLNNHTHHYAKKSAMFP